MDLIIPKPYCLLSILILWYPMLSSLCSVVVVSSSSSDMLRFSTPPRPEIQAGFPEDALWFSWFKLVFPWQHVCKRYDREDTGQPVASNRTMATGLLASCPACGHGWRKAFMYSFQGSRWFHNVVPTVFHVGLWEACICISSILLSCLGFGVSGFGV